MLQAHPSLRSLLLCGLLLTLTVPLEARSQESSDSKPSAKPGQVEQIIVTARKKAELLEDTPVSVTALTADALEAYQITNVAQIGQITPNLTFDTSAPLTGSNSSSSIYIRGIGSSEFALSTDPGVGVYVDGVYLARSLGGVLDVVDAERIEVLRGPQGTLFGRNTIGGAINIISKRPEAELGGQAKVTVGTDSLTRWQGTLNLPMSETLLSRISFMRTRQDGYVSNRFGSFSDAGDENSWSARGTLQWLVSDSISLTINTDVTREREKPAPNVLVDFTEQGPLGAPGAGRSFVGIFNDIQGLMGACPNSSDLSNPACFNAQNLNGPFATSGGFVSDRDPVNGAASKPLEPDSDLDIWGTSATLDWELSQNLTLRSISAYRRLDSFFVLDIDHTTVPILDTVNDFAQDQTSQELQLLGKAMDDRLDYTIGAYYFQENGDHKDVVSFLPGAILSGGKFDNRGIATFGQMTYAFTDQLQVTAGLRYNYEKKIFDVQRQQALTDVLPPPGSPDPIIPAGLPLVLSENKATNRDRAVTPHLSVSYFWNDDIMTYASYSEGFKGGGFQQRIFPPRATVPKFDNETARVFEIGAKTTLFDSRLRLSGAMFFTDYEDLQIAVAEGIAPILANAGEAQIRGFEVEGLLRATPELTLAFGLGYTDAQYSEIDSLGTGVDRSNEFTNTPDWSASAALSYELYLGSTFGSAIAQLGWSYRSEVFNDAFNTPSLMEDQLNLFDASIAWELPEEEWRVVLSARNLTDRTYIVSGANVPLAGVVEASFARGRTFELSVERNF